MQAYFVPVADFNGFQGQNLFPTVQALQSSQIPATLPPISGCALWLDAADSATVITSGSNVTQWNDKSGNGRNATPVGGPTYSGTAIDLRNGSRLTGPINISSGTLLTTSFCVAVSPTSYDPSTNRLLSAWSGTTNDFAAPTGFAYSAITSSGVLYAYRNVGANMTTTLSSNIMFMQTTITFSNGGFIASLNGNFPNGNSLSFGSNTNTCNTNAFTNYFIGSTNVGIQLWRGLVNEFIIYNRTLSQQEYQQVEGYLARKWGLNLPVAHPYFNSLFFSPTVPIFSTTITNITGTINQSFLPTFLSGLSLWLDASDVSTIRITSGIVTQWYDKSGNSRNYAYTGPNLYNSANKSVYTTGTSYFYSPADIRKTVTPNMTLFMVHRHTNNSNPVNQGLWGNEVGGNWNRFQVLNYSSISYSISAGSATTCNVPGLNTPNRVVYSCVLSLNTSNGSAVYINGTSGVTFTETAAFTNATTSNIYFGTFDASIKSAVEFNEIILYSNALTNNQRQQVEGYLAWKWGLTGNLPSTHPNAFMPP